MEKSRVEKMQLLDAFKAETGCVGVSQGYLSNEKNEELARNLILWDLRSNFLQDV